VLALPLQKRCCWLPIKSVTISAAVLYATEINEALRSMGFVHWPLPIALVSDAQRRDNRLTVFEIIRRRMAGED
jgi:glutamate formiminotransferase